MTERNDLEAWADALLDQHRTAPKSERSERSLLDDLDPATRLLVESRSPAAPATAPSTHRAAPAAANPDEWVGKAQAMGGVLVAILLLSLVLALAAG